MNWRRVIFRSGLPPWEKTLTNTHTISILSVSVSGIAYYDMEYLIVQREVMPKKVTIDDIARLAGVSRTTISRVLNHKPDVDPAT
jgi:Bacterial regulatory proteins, lacI family